MSDNLMTIGKVTLAVIVGLPLVVWLVQDRLLFYPQPLSDARRAEVVQRFAGVREVFIQSEDQKKLHAWHVAGAPDAALVIYFGGNAEEVSWMIGESARTPG